MKKLRMILISFAMGIAVEFLLLALGGFDLRVGGDGPASMLLFITHMPAGLLCAMLPISWQTEVAVAAANTLLLSGTAFIIIALLRARRAHDILVAQRAGSSEPRDDAAVDMREPGARGR